MRSLPLFIPQPLPNYLALVFEFDLFAFDLIVDGAKIGFGQVFGIVDAAIHFNVLFFRHFVFDVGTVKIRRQHDDGVSQNVSGVSAGEDF